MGAIQISDLQITKDLVSVWVTGKHITNVMLSMNTDDFVENMEMHGYSYDDVYRANEEISVNKLKAALSKLDDQVYNRLIEHNFYDAVFQITNHKINEQSRYTTGSLIIEVLNQNMVHVPDQDSVAFHDLEILDKRCMISLLKCEPQVSNMHFNGRSYIGRIIIDNQIITDQRELMGLYLRLREYWQEKICLV